MERGCHFDARGGEAASEMDRDGVTAVRCGVMPRVRNGFGARGKSSGI